MRFVGCCAGGRPSIQTPTLPRDYKINCAATERTATAEAGTAAVQQHQRFTLRPPAASHRAGFFFFRLYVCAVFARRDMQFCSPFLVQIIRSSTRRRTSLTLSHRSVRRQSTRSEQESLTVMLVSPPFQLATPPGFHVNHISKGSLVEIMECLVRFTTATESKHFGYIEGMKPRLWIHSDVCATLDVHATSA